MGYRATLAALAVASACTQGLNIQRASAQAPYSSQRVIAQNALVSGVLSSVGAAVRGKNIVHGFVKGASGGALVGAAYVCVGNTIDCAWPAKFVAATGVALVRSGARDTPVLGELAVPVGPLVLSYHKGRVRSDWNERELATLYRLASHGSIDAGRSLRAGTPILYGQHRDERIIGAAVGQAVLIDDSEVLRSTAQAPELDRVQRHELVHVLQHELWGAYGGAVFRTGTRLPFTSYSISESYMGELAVGNALRAPAYAYRPHEREAMSVAKRQE